MAAIRCEGIVKTYPGGQEAVRGVDLEIADGELLVLVGPSGCGKSTFLRMVAGLETPTRGRIRIGARDVTELSPPERDVAMVFQTYALYPHKTVRENLEFPLRMRRTPPERMAERVEEIARVLGLSHLLDRKPRQLSGGQRQRVALGRAMVRQPQAFLLDEPLSNLDARLRVETRAELARTHRRLGATMLYVTHDQEEAMTLGDRIAVMRDGEILQVAAPMEVYLRPSGLFVAGFIGSPEMNFFACSALLGDSGWRLAGRSFSIESPVPPPETGDLTLGIRPPDVEIVETGRGDVSGRIDVIEPLGSQLLIHVESDEDTGGRAVRVTAPPDPTLREGAAVGLRLRRDRLHLFEKTTGRRLN